MESKKEEFFKEIKNFPEINKFFLQFQPEELFSDDFEIMHQCFQKIISSPVSLTKYNKKFKSSFLAKYLSLAIPSELTDLLIMDLSIFLGKFTQNDLNFIVPIIATRLSFVQKTIALFNFPDCAATFILLTSLFQDSNYFILSFQRIYASYNLVPKICRRIINSSLKASLLKGPARYHYLNIFPILISDYSKTVRENEKRETSPFENFLDMIIDTHPSSTQHLKSEEIERIVSMILKINKLPYQALLFFELVKANPVLSYEQADYLIWNSPEILFDYLKKVDMINSETLFASLMYKLPNYKMEFPNQDYILTVYKHILLFSIDDSSHIRFVFQPNIQWIHNTLRCMRGNSFDFALMAINLLMMRFFNLYSKTFIECNDFDILIRDSLNSVTNKILFIDTFLYSIDPENIQFPFEEAIQLNDLQPSKFPPPSTCFIFKIVPTFLNTILKFSIDESVKLNELSKNSQKNESETNKGSQNKESESNEDSKNNENESNIDSQNSKSELNEDCKIKGNESHQAEKNESNEKIKDEENISPILRYFIKRITALIKDFRLAKFLISISKSNDFSRLIKLALKDSEVFEFVSLIIGFSGKYDIFHSFFTSISTDMKQTIKFLSYASESAQIVTDFLYINQEISMPLSSSSEVITMWVRPLSGISPLFQIKTNKISITMKISTEKFYISMSQEMKLPPSINGWYFITISFFQFNVILISFNLDTVKAIYQNPIFPLNSFIIGGENSNFDLQSIRVYKSLLSEDDFLQAFSLGPNYNGPFYGDFTLCSETPSYITQNGFISKHYLPFLPKLIKKTKFDCNSLIHNLEYALLPPYKTIFYHSKNPELNLDQYKCSMYSFLNSLQCHGGINLIIHLIAEVILKYPSLKHQLFSGFLYNIFHNFPIFNLFFQKKSVYKSIGHLLWSGNVLASETFNLAIEKFEGHCYLTNPYIIKHWLFEGQLYLSEMPEFVNVIIDSLSIQWNYNILVKSKIFMKIINLLCGKSIHTDAFLNSLSLLAFKLTSDENIEANLKLVFDRLILCHFSFSRQENLKNEDKESKAKPKRQNSYRKKLHEISLDHNDIHPLNTIYLIRILNLLLVHYSSSKVDLELLIPAISTSVPAIQAELIKILLIHLDYKYLHFLSFLLKQLPYIKEVVDSIHSILNENTSSLTFVQITTGLTYLISHAECKDLALRWCSQASSSSSSLHLTDIQCNVSDESNVAFNQAVECIAITEQSTNLLHFDENQELADLISSMIFSALLKGIYDLVAHFYYTIKTIPNVSIFRCTYIVLYFMNKMIKTIFNYHINSSISESNSFDNSVDQQSGASNYSNYSNGFDIDKIVEISTNLPAFLIQKIRLTPGSLNEQIITLIEEFVDTLISFIKLSVSNDSASNLVYLLISVFHIKFPQSFSKQIISTLNEIPKVLKQKRYQELVDRIEQPEIMIPASFPEPEPYLIKQIEKKWYLYSDADQKGLFLLCCSSIHQQMFILNTFQTNSSDNDNVIDLWNSVFTSLFYPESTIYQDCPVKWKISEYSMNYKQRLILVSVNPSLDKLYDNFWNIKYQDEIFPSIRLKLSEVLQFTSISLYNAQDVKFSSSAHHFKGIINFVGVLLLTTNKIKFYPRPKSSSPISTNDDFCLNYITIKLFQITSIKIKMFHHQQTGIEIFCKEGNTYIFSFENTSICDSFIESISQLTMYNISIIKSANAKEIQNMMQKWVEGKITNFDYLLFLNEQSGRSWNDLTQYPIFPWIIKNYTSRKIDLNDSSNYRDLSLPIFAQSLEQQQQCLKYYETTSSLSDGDGHCVSSYFSNVGSALYFLVRLEPFTNEEISFQGGDFDAADRTFQSFDISYSIMVAHGNKGSLELVPDFYFNEEALKNVNQAKFPESVLSNRVVNDVILPPWASSYREVVRVMRKSLELEYSSSNLNYWIDLVWGFRRRGAAALEKYNVFQKSVFEFDVNEVIENRALFKAMCDQISNCGQAAYQLFKAPHPKKNVVDNFQDFEGKLQYQQNRKLPAYMKKLEFAFNGDDWIKISNDSEGNNNSLITSVRINNGNLEYLTSQNTSFFINFTEEISVTSIDVMDNLLLTGHNLPLVNIWSLTNKKLPVITVTLNCHMSPVSFVYFFSDDWPMFAAGHEDGFVSLYSLHPVRFLRTISIGLKDSVSFIRNSKSTGDILVVQGKYLVLWTINGELVNSVHINDGIVDVVFTDFTDGYRNNFIFLLCDNGNILSLNSFDLNIICYYPNNSNPRVKPVSLCFCTDTLYVKYSDSSISCWKII